MSLFDIFRKPAGPMPAEQAAAEARQAEIARFVRQGEMPPAVQERLQGARAGTVPWTATLTPAELVIARSHGLRPVATVAANCWLHYGWSWTLGHSEGWAKALERLKQEARAAGANAVLDVKMRTVRLTVGASMDFTLIGTAVHVDGLEPSRDPIVATVPALEFVKLIEADVVPTGIAVGAHYQWLSDFRGPARTPWMGNNVESLPLSQLWTEVRRRAHQDLREAAHGQGNGVLAHVNFSEMIESESEDDKKDYLARHIVVATTVDARRGAVLSHDIKMVADMHAGRTPLTGTARHHQSYGKNESQGAL